MTDLSLDDQLKQAQIDKARAESTKLQREADSVARGFAAPFWSEAIKVVGGVILGIGGLVAAVTQFEVAELKKEKADLQLEQINAKKVAAEAEAKEATEKRDKAIREGQDAEQAVAEYKAFLTQQAKDTRSGKPDLEKTRLAYVQFQGDISRSVINELRKHLQGSGFNAPGAERVPGEYASMVKYFSPTDSKPADRLARSVEEFFAKKGCPLTLKTVASGESGSPLEVWLSHGCKA